MKLFLPSLFGLVFAVTGTGQAPAKMPPLKSAGGQAPSWTSPPKLVVGIVVDQMRTDYIYRYWNNFGEGGFKRLIGEGAFQRNAHYNYAPTVTGPGHASIYTGTVPAHHGIVGNEMYDRAKRKTYYCVGDPSVQGIGSANATSSPHLLLATTLADEIERRTDGKGRTIGVALKDRSSVLPIGRTGDAAYWYSSNGSFVTSTWYMTEPPAWLNAFNAKALPQKYLDRTWEPLLRLARYHQALPDKNNYEQELTPGAGCAFPYDLAALSRTAGLGLISTTPWGNTLTTDMALAAMAGEQMGKDSITDLLAISYSSTDILGHKMGLRALEVEDMYIRLDQEIARLLTELDKQIGAGKYTLFLTADHGAVDVPAYLKDLKGSAGYVDVKSLVAPVAEGMKDADSILFIGDGQIFLERPPVVFHGAVASSKYFDRHDLVEALLAHPAIHSAFLAQDGLGIHRSAEDRAELLVNGYMHQRCGDILYTLKPGYFEADGAFLGKGTTHGSVWNYDTHVPVLFYGQGIKHTEVTRRTAITDVVPTVCMIVGCALPDAAVGEPVPEVLR